MPKRILVTGATGYVAGRLIPRLIDCGYEVRALARNPRKLRSRSWFGSADIVQGDVMDSASLTAAMKDIHTAYYLVHNMSSGHGYTRIEIQSAQNFARAAEEAGVKHIIYLGGLADPEQHIAPHMRSRIETGVALRAGKVPVTEFRAGVIAGSGSISFEMIRFMTELLPIIPAPAWLRNNAQPIAVQNVIDYLLAALENWDGHGQVFEIGGPEIMPYHELMSIYARVRGLKRKFLLLPYIPLDFMAFGIGLTTPVPRPIAYALVGGLSRDSVALNNNVRDVYPINLAGYESVAKSILENLHPYHIERVWDGDLKSLNPFKHEGFFIDQRTIKIEKPAGQVLDAIQNLRVKNFAIESKSDSGVLFRSVRTKFGLHWMEYEVGESRLTQTSYFAPHGLMGFLYGYLLYPFHAFAFHRLIKRISRITN